MVTKMKECSQRRINYSADYVTLPQYSIGTSFGEGWRGRTELEVRLTKVGDCRLERSQELWIRTQYVRMLVNMGIVIRQIVRWVRWFQIVPLVDESPIRMFSKAK